MSKVTRFPLRAVGAILVCREREHDGWRTISGAHGWSFGSLAEARIEADWLATNLGGLPVRVVAESAS